MSSAMRAASTGRLPLMPPSLRRECARAVERNDQLPASANTFAPS